MLKKSLLFLFFFLLVPSALSYTQINITTNPDAGLGTGVGYDTTSSQKQGQQYNASINSTLAILSVYTGTDLGAPSDDINISIYLATNGTPAGGALASVIIADASWLNNQWINATLEFNFTQGNRYWFQVERTGALDINNLHRIGKNSVTDDYIPGSWWTYANSAWSNNTYDLPFILWVTPAPSVSNFTITATNNFNSTALNVFNVSMTDGVQTFFYQTTTGTVTTGALTNSSTLWNISVSSANHWNATRTAYNVTPGSLAVGLDQYPFIMINDSYNGSVLSSFNATISNVTYSTSGNQVFVPINSNASTSVTIAKANYFSRTVSLVLVANGNKNSSLWQSEINVTVVDAVTGSSLLGYNFTIPLLSFIGNETPQVLHLSANSFTANVSLSGYQNASSSFTLSALESRALTISLAPLINFTIIREKTGGPFNVSGTQSTIMTIYCDGTSQQYTFTNENQSAYINCTWTLMKLDVVYSGSTGSYFRTLIPSSSSRAITWYALDLTQDTAVQVNFILNDLVGTFSGSTLYVQQVVNSTNRNIVTNTFDLQNQVTAYLLLNGAYTLTIVNSEGTSRSLGYYIADSAGDKTITIPNIAFLPSSTLGQTVSWDWSQSDSNAIRLVYNDTYTQTNNLTFTVYSGTNTSQTLYTTIGYNVGFSTYSYAITNTSSYLACFSAKHSVQGNISECKPFSDFIFVGNTTGFTGDEEDKTFNWAVLILIIVVILACSRSNISVGLAAAVVIEYIAIKWGWLNLGSTWLNYAVLSITAAAAVITYIVEDQRS